MISAPICLWIIACISLAMGQPVIAMAAILGVIVSD